MPNQQEVQNYLNKVLKIAEDSPEKLSREERRLVDRYRRETQRLHQINSDISQIRDQIRQGEARLRSLELQAADVTGRASATLDYLASLKFEEDMPMPKAPEPPVPPEPTVEKTQPQEQPS